MKFATKAIHAGNEAEAITGAIMPPIYMTSTFVQEAPGETKGYEYTRAGNPNFTILEKLLAALEEGKYATVFSSGLGALTGLISTFRKAIQSLGLMGFMEGLIVYSMLCLNAMVLSFLSIHKPTKEALEEALSKKPKWLFFETPTNPLLEIFDIAELVQNCKKTWSVNHCRQHLCHALFSKSFEAWSRCRMA